MTEITIRTNNQPRELLSLSEVPPNVAREFAYIQGEDAYSPRLFRYRGAWYDANEFTYIDPVKLGVNAAPYKGWNGVHPDTYFSGVLIRWADRECERVIVGTYFS